MSRLARTSTLAAAVLTLAASALPAVATASHPAGKSPCFGKQPTIFSGANGVHLVGTGKGDVIEATGTNVTVSGGGGNDRICVNGAKSVDGGAGDDRIRFASGSAKGGPGLDTIVKVGSGKGSIDGGVGPNTLTIPTSALVNTRVTYHSGDVINGTYARIDAPSGAPSFSIGFKGQPGPAVLVTEDQPYSEVSPTNDGGVEFFNAVPANGRTLASWALSWGDGSPAEGGPGGPPANRPHLYLAAGRHTMIATVTDSLGATSTQTQVVDVAFTAQLSVVVTGATTSASKTFTPTYVPGANAHATGWYMRFGDGTSTSGPGAPPALISHTYGSPGSYTSYLMVFDDHGGLREYGASATYAPAAGPYTAFELVDDANHLIVPYAADEPSFDTAVAPGGSVFAADEVTVISRAYGGAYVSSVGWGDGVTNTSNYHYYTSGPAPMTRTITVHWQDGADNPLPPMTQVITVQPQSWRAALTPPAQVVPEGPVTFRTAGTVLPPAGVSYRWVLYWNDGSVPTYGFGPIPAAFTRTMASGEIYPELELYPARGQYVRAEPDVFVTSPAPRIQYFGGGGNSDYVPALVGPDAANGTSVAFSGSIAPSLGARVAKVSIAFGDGASTTVPEASSGYFGYEPETRHGYTTPGTFVATLRATDSRGRVATAVNHVSVAGLPTVASPATLAATQAVPVALPLTGVASGANATMSMYDIDWDDSATIANPDTLGYGSVPASPSHTYASAGTYTVTVTVYNDHFGIATTTTKVTVT